MGKINKALNRSNYKSASRGGMDRNGGRGGFSNSYQTKRQQETQQKELIKEEKKDLKLI